METTFKTINISGVESNEKKITLLQGKEKYYFWITKKDGSSTKAYEQFQKFRFNAGDSVEIAVKEEERTFTNGQGKEITYTDRNIAYFKTLDENTPSTIGVAQKTPPNAPQSVTGGIEERLSKIETRLNALEGKEEKDIIDSIPF
jgi:hypothetical protein